MERQRDRERDMYIITQSKRDKYTDLANNISLYPNGSCKQESTYKDKDVKCDALYPLTRSSIICWTLSL